MRTNERAILRTLARAQWALRVQAIAANRTRRCLDSTTRALDALVREGRVEQTASGAYTITPDGRRILHGESPARH